MKHLPQKKPQRIQTIHENSGFHLTQTPAIWLIRPNHLKLASATCVFSVGPQDGLILYKSRAIPATQSEVCAFVVRKHTGHFGGLHGYRRSYQRNTGPVSTLTQVSWHFMLLYWYMTTDLPKRKILFCKPKPQTRLAFEVLVDLE